MNRRLDMTELLLTDAVKVLGKRLSESVLNSLLGALKCNKELMHLPIEDQGGWIENHLDGLISVVTETPRPHCESEWGGRTLHAVSFSVYLSRSRCYSDSGGGEAGLMETQGGGCCRTPLR